MHKELCFKLSFITGIDSSIKNHLHINFFSWNHAWKSISQRLKAYVLFVNNYTY